MIHNITACQRETSGSTLLHAVCTDCGHNGHLHPGVSNPGLRMCVGCAVMQSYEFWDQRPVLEGHGDWIDAWAMHGILQKRQKDFEAKKAQHLEEVRKRKELKNEQ